MIVYCDRLTVLSAAKALSIIFRSHQQPGRIVVLDPLPPDFQTSFLRGFFKLVGVTIEEGQFFTGNLRTPEGEIVLLAALRLVQELSWNAAVHTVKRAPLLARLNDAFGRNTLLLWLAKECGLSIDNTVLHLLVARSLAAREGAQATVVVRCPRCFLFTALTTAIPDMKVCFYGRLTVVMREKVSLVKCFVRLSSAFFHNLWRRILFPIRHTTIPSGQKVPGLLLLQEGNLSMDRSYRTQPHWLFPAEELPHFATYIIATYPEFQRPHDDAELAAQRVSILRQKDITQLAYTASAHPLNHQLSRSWRSCFWAAFLGRSSADTALLISLMRLFARARLLAGLCRALHIRAFMTAENYMDDAAALQLVSPPLGISTFSYHYSNMSSVSPPMMTTADVMFTFAPHYHNGWCRGEIRPRAFIDVGYTFDSSFELVKARAHRQRNSLKRNGVEFVLGYFDENVQHSKYGMINGREHRNDIAALIKLLLSDPTTALVVKTQYQRNAPENHSALHDLLKAARATGRYVPLSHGVYRNIVLPAEAGLIADISIGHVNGATAALEVALAGGRSILLNPWGMKGINDQLYAQGDIVYPSLAAALKAIRDYRAGLPQRSKLGDWSPILHHFDPFRDGKSAQRMRAVLEKAVLEDKI